MTATRATRIKTDANGKGRNRHIEKLTMAAQRRDEARRALQRAEENLRKTAVAADASRTLARLEIAELTGVARSTLYAWVEEGRSS